MRRDNVCQSWEATEQQLVQGHQLFIFKQANLRTVSWIEEKEAFLNNDDLGDSIAAVEALLRKCKLDADIHLLRSQRSRTCKRTRRQEDVESKDDFEGNKAWLISVPPSTWPTPFRGSLSPRLELVPQVS